MCSEATKESSDKSGKGGFICCAGKSDLPDCAEIMSHMKAGCCGPEGGCEKK